LNSTLKEGLERQPTKKRENISVMSNYFGAIDPFDKDNVLSKQILKEVCLMINVFRKRLSSITSLVITLKKISINLRHGCRKLRENCRKQAKKNYLKTKIYVKM
jgi:hypothetical protein